MRQERSDSVDHLVLAGRYTKWEKGDAAGGQNHANQSEHTTYSFRDAVKRSIDLTVLMPLEAEEMIFDALVSSAPAHQQPGNDLLNIDSTLCTGK